MSQYRNGFITSTAAAVTLDLGFVPDRFTVTNITKTDAGSGVGFSEFINGATAAGKAYITTYTVGAPVVSLLASNGFTAVESGASWTATQATISGATKANPCVITATAHGFSTGDIVTISSVVGMVQLNTNRYKIVRIDANSFSLKDLFGNNVDSTAFGTYVSGGIANKISDSSTPPGNQYDTGKSGITLGTGVVGSSNDVLYYEAFYSTPTGW